MNTTSATSVTAKTIELQRLLLTIIARNAELSTRYSSLLESPREKNMNVLQYSLWCEVNFRRNLKDNTGLVSKWTWFSDISIAEWFGVSEVFKTIMTAIRQWIDNYECIAELLLSVNYKAWEMSARKKTYWTSYYSKLYYVLYYAILNYYDQMGNSKATVYLCRYLD